MVACGRRGGGLWRGARWSDVTVWRADRRRHDAGKEEPGDANAVPVGWTRVRLDWPGLGNGQRATQG